MIRTRVPAALGVAALISIAGAAQAHVALEAQEAAADSYYKAVLGVAHGCSGSPTVGLLVRIPEGVTSVRPQPKPGWELEIVTEELAEPAPDAHGHGATTRVSEIRWSGGRLLDEHYDEFIMRLRLPDAAGETLYIPTVQVCEEGTDRWIEIPEEGQPAHELGHPAPQLHLTPPE